MISEIEIHFKYYYRTWYFITNVAKSRRYTLFWASLILFTCMHKDTAHLYSKALNIPEVWRVLLHKVINSRLYLHTAERAARRVAHESVILCSGRCDCLQEGENKAIHVSNINSKTKQSNNSRYNFATLNADLDYAQISLTRGSFCHCFYWLQKVNAHQSVTLCIHIQRR